MPHTRYMRGGAMALRDDMGNTVALPSNECGWAAAAMPWRDDDDDGVEDAMGRRRRR